jgi:exodeoxyribonuclease X
VDLLRVVDFETCGDKPPAEVIEVGTCDVVRAPDGVWVPCKPRSFLCGAKELTAETRAVHHITPAEIAGAVAFDARQLVEHASADGVGALAAHNASFEGKWLAPSLGTMPIFCTYKAALRIWPDAPSHKNQVLRYWMEDKLGIIPELAHPPHRAGPDAYVTAHVLSMLLRHTTVEEMLVWSVEPALLPRIPIGPQRGQPWSMVDAGFLSWMLKNATMDPDLKWNARRELDRRSRDVAGLRR